MIKSFSLSSFVIGVMLGAVLAAAWFLGDSFSIPSINYPSFTATSTVSNVNDSGALSVADQMAGTTVIIESITVPPPGVWIAIREINGGDLGNVLGALRVDGPRSSVSVSLLRATEPNKSYAAELYRDDNNGNFDPAANSAYVDFNTGEPVIVHFTTTE